MVAEAEGVLDVGTDLDRLLEAQLGDVADAVDGGVAPVGDLQGVPPLTRCLLLLLICFLRGSSGRDGSLGVNLIELQYTFQQYFQQSFNSSVGKTAVLRMALKWRMKFN